MAYDKTRPAWMQSEGSPTEEERSASPKPILRTHILSLQSLRTAKRRWGDGVDEVMGDFLHLPAPLISPSPPALILPRTAKLLQLSYFISVSSPKHQHSAAPVRLFSHLQLE